MRAFINGREISERERAAELDLYLHQRACEIERGEDAKEPDLCCVAALLGRKCRCAERGEGGSRG